MAKTGKKSKRNKQLDIAKNEKRALREEADLDSKTFNRDEAVSTASKSQPEKSNATSVGTHQRTPVPSVAKRESVAAKLSSHASTLLAIAAGIVVLLGIVMFGFEGGKQAVPTIGGVLNEQVPAKTANIVFMLDTLFPIFFGAGLIVFASSFQSRGNRPLVRLILTVLMISILADFVENSLAYSVMNGGDVSPLKFPATVIKYAGLAIAGVMLSCLVARVNSLATSVHVILRYVFPISVSLLIAGIGGETVRIIVGASFPVILLILAVYATKRAEDT